jgi:hypothetical protein
MTNGGYDMIVGTKVKKSGYSLKGKRDYWQSLGRQPAKSNAKQAYENAQAERGTVSAILKADKSRGISAGLEITWDNGSISKCLNYMVEPE